MRLVPRFAVEQGVKPDGSAKIRAIDHFSWSAPDAATAGMKRTRKVIKAHSVNGHYTMNNELTHDHLDILMEAMRLHFETFGSVSNYWYALRGECSSTCVMCKEPGLWKADIDAAYRRVPLKDKHKWAAGVMPSSAS